MLSKYRILAGLISTLISLFSTLAIAMLTKTPLVSLGGTFVIILLCALIIIYTYLEKVFLKEIKDLNKSISLLKSPKDNRRKSKLNSIKDIKREVMDFAHEKQKEIEELKKRAAFRREFIANVSHELKTPIFAAQGFVHTLLDGAIKDKSVRERFLKKAASNLDGLDELVHDLLALSQIETGEVKLQYEYVNMVDLTMEAFEAYESRAVKKNIKLILGKTVKSKSSGAIKRVYAYADSSLINQVVMNLISNAVKYTDSGKVTIEIIEKDNIVEVQVKDSGRGIPSKHLPRIFERFYRIEKSRSKEKDRGTGLGLAIVKHILEAHSSRIEVISTEGTGSVFSFKLPKDQATNKQFYS